MPEDPIAALNEGAAEDTPETPEVVTEAPVEDTPTPPAVNFQQRYESLRPEFDRTKQQLAEEREARLQYEAELERLRQQPNPIEDDLYEDDPLLSKLEQLEARLAAREQQEAARQQEETLRQQREQEITHIDNELASIEDEFGDELSDQEARMLGNFALANRDEHGRPDVRLAYQTFNEVFEGRKAKWVSSKPSGGKPAAGPGAVEVPDLDNPDDVEKYLNSAFEAHFGG